MYMLVQKLKKKKIAEWFFCTGQNDLTPEK